jgi:mono/diheme cytochrome c family protein
MHGRSGMPSFKDKLSPGEVSALVAYVRAFRN